MKAFPNQLDIIDHCTFREVMKGGMDLRDYFAAKALNGMLSAEVNSWRRGYETYEEYLTDLTMSAYKMADAMMEARNGTT